jgi:dephospho-CoA kinase
MRIGIVGPMGSGKTTVANILTEHYGFRRKSLAKPVKAIADGMDLYPDSIELEEFLKEWAMGLLPDPIYYEMLSPDGLTSHQLLVRDWIAAYETAKTKRELYQRVGTDCGRAVKPNIWIDWFARHLAEGDVVIDDVRFINEGQALTDLGFHLIRLDPLYSTRAERLIDRDGALDLSRMNHASETEQDEIVCDTVWHNSDGILSLQHQVGQLIGKLRIGVAA